METMDVASASFFLSSVVILDRSTALTALWACTAARMPVSLHPINHPGRQNGGGAGPEGEGAVTGEQAGRMDDGGGRIEEEKKSCVVPQIVAGLITSLLHVLILGRS